MGNPDCCDLSSPQELEVCSPSLSLEARLQDLPLCEMQIKTCCSTSLLATKFESNPLIPGITLIEKDEFVGMISRRRFFEFMSSHKKYHTYDNQSIKNLYSDIQPENFILPEETLIVTAVQKVLSRPQEERYEPIIVKSKSNKYYVLDVYRLLVAQNKIHELATKLLREKTQSLLIQTEKMTSLGKMVTGVAHEIKNPVNCIAGNFNFLSNYFKNLLELIVAYGEECIDPSEKITEIKERIEFDFLIQDLAKILESINVSSNRLTQVTTSLRNFSRIDDKKRQKVDIHECIDSTLLILSSQIKRGIKVIKNYGQLPKIKCYPGQLSQVFMNLLSNAIDALIESKVNSQDWQPWIEITTQLIEEENEQSIIIKIADNGTGIPTEIQKNIFEDFFTTKPVGKGTGLGLAISYEIVTKKHGGKMQVFSQPNIGSEFQIILPIG
ncbi:MAG: GHKL domain-containing protein [Scytonematopsis contorta HA4267-MV1]|jgi:signal transduction histidine kinase|nr:GHKL domain-containing protein [Scytonematopsis contorta HA4267-MV1]